MQKIIYSFLLIIFLSACSVSTAMTGKLPPDFSKVTVDAKRTEIESIVGRHEKIILISNGQKVHIYKYYAGYAPSFLKIVANALMDAVTLGFWEFVAPQNTVVSRINITYDKDDKVTSINKYMPRG